MYLKYLILLLFWYIPSYCFAQGLGGGKPCKVIEQATGELKECQFPFIHKEEAYYGCNTVDGIDGKAWCSTRTDPLSYEHEEGYHGNCPNPDGNSQYACKSHEEGLKQSENFNDFQNSLGRQGPRSQNEIIDACGCQPYKTCKWANETAYELTELARGSRLYKKRFTTFRKRICDAKTRGVYCCDDDQMPPSDNELEILKNPDEYKTVTEKKNLGTWKPDGYEEECGLRTQLSNIAGGRRAKLGDFPYMALLGYKNFNNSEGKEIKSYDCGGSLINKWYVLTAAHCMFETSGKHAVNRPSEVVLGELRIDTDPDCTTDKRTKIENCAPPKITREITSDDQIIVHEDYRPGSNTQVNDIALIRLNEPVPLYDEDPMKSFVKPICLPWKEDDPGRTFKKNAKAVVTGWGKIKTNIKDINRKLKFGASANYLLYVRLPIANDVCNADPVLAPYWDPETKVCAGGEIGKDACQGDSGGPLVIRDSPDEPWYQIGLVSFGLERVCGGRKNDVKRPGIFTKVIHYLPWIESKLQE